MKARALVGILAGYAAWWVLFLGSLAVSGTLWPAFLEAGRPVFDARDYSQLTTPMLVLSAGIWLYTNLGTGWITARIAGSRMPVWFVAVPLFAYLAYSHLYRLWFDLPPWYNLTVVAIFPPLVLLGARLARVRGRA